MPCKEKLSEETVQEEWFSKWFQQDYLELYPHRDKQEAAAQIAFLCEEKVFPVDAQVLDIACGPGRHMLELARREIDVIGLDLSQVLLDLAKENLEKAGLVATLVKGDMRSLPFVDQRFTTLLSMFTSVGYFENIEMHSLLFAQWRRVIKTGGKLVIDYLNRDYVISNLQAGEKIERDETNILIERSISQDGLRVEKSIVICDKSNNLLQSYRESVLMFSVSEILQLLDAAGFSKEKLYGDFQGSCWSKESPRSLFIVEAI